MGDPRPIVGLDVEHWKLFSSRKTFACRASDIKDEALRHDYNLSK